jgi:hypothetical protein
MLDSCALPSPVECKGALTSGEEAMRRTGRSCRTLSADRTGGGVGEESAPQGVASAAGEKVATGCIMMFGLVMMGFPC